MVLNFLMDQDMDGAGIKKKLLVIIILGVITIAGSLFVLVLNLAQLNDSDKTNNFQSIENYSIGEAVNTINLTIVSNDKIPLD